MNIRALLTALGITIPQSKGAILSPVQARKEAAWEADAPRRDALAHEIIVWNAGIKRRNQRHVARNIARGRAA